ncbi:MAG: flagellar filament capping protein FliD [Alphaproteobacteria bacterium]|nr:flagellar filament capping protein FliD [Alphaproteobacteria bacterium]
MVQLINLGNVTSGGSGTTVSGLSSGLDTDALVESLVAARTIPVDQLQTKIDANTGKVTAFGELKSALDALQSAASLLRNPPGVQNDSQNIFRYRTSTLSSNTSVSADTYLSLAAEPGAAIGTHTIEIGTIAKAKSDITSVGFADRTSSVVEAAAGATAGMFSAGVITLNALGTNVDIELEENDSLNDIAQKINSQKATSGVEASVLKVADNDYRLLLTSVNTGTAYAYTLTDDGSGVYNEIGFSSVEGADNATLTVDGVPITRSSNAIDDIFDNVTLTLKQPTPALTELTTNVVQDTETIYNGILNFIDAYNSFKLFYANQNARDSSGAPLETAVLSSNPALRTILERLQNVLSSAVDGLDEDFDDLSDIGITFSDFPGDAENAAARNILVVDTDELQNALSSNFEDVRKIFEFDFVSDNTDLQVYSRTNALGVSEFTLDIDTVAGTAQATYDPGTGPVTIDLDYEVSGGSIVLTGQDDTVLEGLTLLYTDTVSDSIEVTISQGFGDLVYNALDSVLESNTGLLDTEVAGLNTLNDKLQTDIDSLNLRIEQFRLSLLERFAQMEAAVARVNTLLQSLEASDLARQNN